MWLFIIVLLGFALNASAYVRTISGTGNGLFWADGNIPLFVNPTNSSGLTDAQVTSMFSGALNSWRATNANVFYSLNVSSGNSTASSQDYTSRVGFSSNSSQKLASNVIAVTYVYYRTDTGQIVESDMTYNDDSFLFTNVEGDTGNSAGFKTKIYLQDVATHEVGHAYGLDHTTVNRSALVYRAFSGQFRLGEDDKTAVLSIYGGTSDRGAISGSVQGSRGGIFGTHVVAINANTGLVQAGVLAEANGNFQIPELPTGNYHVMVEPFYPSTSTVSYFYKNIDHRFCSGSRFRRTFYGSCGNAGTPTTIRVSGDNANIGVVSPSCSSMGNPGGTPTSIGSARTIATTGGSFYGTLSSGGSHFFRINGFSGTLNAKALSWSLFSALDVKVDILNADGTALAGAMAIDNVDTIGGKANYDASANAVNLSGDYIIRVSSNGTVNTAISFPAGSEFVDSSSFYLLIINANGSIGTPTITDMSACANINNVVQGGSTSGTPRKPGSGGDEGTEGGCGTITHMGSNGDGSGGPPMYSTSIFFILISALLTRLLPALAQVRRKR